MKKTRTRMAAIAASLCAVSAPALAAESAPWMAQIGGEGPEIVFDVAETSDGRLCATGTFHNDARVGDAGQETVLVAEHIQDIYVACFHEDGKLAFAKQLGAGINEEPRALAALPGGDLLVTGFFQKSVGVGRENRLQAEGGSDIFLLRLDSRGEQVWARRFGGRLGDAGNALAVSDTGDIFVAGSFSDVIFYEHEGKTPKVASRGNRDAFVFRLDGSGDIAWAASFGGAGRDEAARVIARPGGGVVFGGTFEGKAFHSDGRDTVSSAGATDAFVIAFDAEGRHEWTRQLGGPKREYLSGLAGTAAGQVIVAGNFQDELVLPAGERLTGAGSMDVFVSSFDAGGRQQWAQSLGSPRIDEAFDLAIGKDGRLAIAGHFQDALALGKDGRQVLEKKVAGDADGFLLWLGPDGQFDSAITASGDGVETAFAVTALRDGGLGGAGYFNRTVTVPFQGLGTLEKRGKTDVFVLRTDGHAAEYFPSATVGDSADRN